MPQEQQLVMRRGDAHPWDFAITLRGAVVNITGMDVRFTAKRRLEDADGAAVMTKTVGAGITVTDSANGKLTVRLAAADTDALTVPTTLYWDLQVTDANGPQTQAFGRLEVLPDVSRTAP